MTEKTTSTKLPYNTPLFERYGKVSDLTQMITGSAHKDGGTGSFPTSPGSRTH
jgi:hypothetical protein